MWIIRIVLLLITIALIGCGAAKTVVVEMATLPETSTSAKIKQLAGDTQNTNPSNCNLPCSVKLEEDDSYEVSLDEPGYYPVVVQFDWLAAYQTSAVSTMGKAEGGFGYYDGLWHTPLVIPLLPRKSVASP
jgi:hypothetical protein